MKKILSIIFSCLICVGCIIPAVAAEKTTISGDSVTATAGETVSIPIYIKNNPGIMGYRITISYNGNVFLAPSVKQGSAFLSGNFNDSIKDNTKNSFDVVWSNTENNSNNGTLFVVCFEINKSAKAGNYSIDISYDQADTFNEKWEDVKLSCDSVSVNVLSDNQAEKDDGRFNFFQTIINIFKFIYNWIVNLFR